MIVFDLVCKCGYEFEGWFSHWQDFAEQQAGCCIECPSCGGSEIHKILSPVTLQNGSSIETEPADGPNEPEQTSLPEALRTLQKFVERNFDDVGTDFANEALKMHYGVTEERNIRGVTTKDEEKTLQEEGIPLLKIPLPSRNRKIN